MSMGGVHVQLLDKLLAITEFSVMVQLKCPLVELTDIGGSFHLV